MAPRRVFAAGGAGEAGDARESAAAVFAVVVHGVWMAVGGLGKATEVGMFAGPAGLSLRLLAGWGE